MEPLTPEQRERITRVFGPAVAGIAEDPPLVCRTPVEIYAAGAEAAAQMPPLTQEQVDRFAVLLAPYRRQLDRQPAAEAS